MATVTAPVRTGASAGAQAAQSGNQASDATSGTGFGDLLAALVPGAAGDAGTATPATTPSGVCGAGPEVSVSPDDAVVGAADSSMVVVGAIGDDTTGSRTGDPGTGTAAETTDGTDATASEPTADPVPGVDAALLAQAQLAALPLLTAATATPVATTTSTESAAEASIAPAGDATTQPAGLAATADGVSGVDTGATSGDQAGTGRDADQGTGGAGQQGGIALTDAGWQPVASSGTGSEATAAALDAVASATPTTAPATAARSEARAADAVPGQVFPEVVRLSQSGNGTHRMTLRLDPGTLGEVKITLTVRDGEVQVRLAAQHDAREVLAQSAPELRRLLEQSGGVDARVAIADLSSGTTTDLSGGAWDRERGTGTGAGADTGEQGHRPGSYDAPGGSASGAARDADPTTGAERARDVRPRPGLDLAL